MENVNLFPQILKTKLNLLFQVYFLGIIQCISAEGLLVTIHKFRIRVQHCHCSSLILMGCKMCVSHPSTHKNSISYLPSSVNQNASVKYISVHWGRINHLPRSKEIFHCMLPVQDYFLHLCNSEGLI